MRNDSKDQEKKAGHITKERYQFCFSISTLKREKEYNYKIIKDKSPEDTNLISNNSLNASKPVNAYLLPTFDATIPV
jgi:hypothetical protein